MIRRRPTICDVWVTITLTATFIGPASAPLGIPDVMWALLRGSWMAANGQLLQTDPFTSAPHVLAPPLNVQWLADLFFHALEAVGGIPLVITATALVVTFTYGVVLAAAITASGHLRLSCVAVLIAYLLGATNLSARPQTLSYALFALFILAVTRAEHRADTRLLWLLPLATAIWTNVHGSFFTGLILLGCAAVGRALVSRDPRAGRPYAVTLAACLIASLINPYGSGALIYVMTIGTNAIIRDLVTEWAPTTVNWREGTLFVGSVLAMALMAARSRVRLTVVEVVSLVVFGYLGWSSIRGIIWWGLVLTPPLARVLGGLRTDSPSRGRDLPAVNAAIIGGTLLVALIALPWSKERLPVLPADKRGVFTADTPVALSAYLQTHDPPPSGRMFNHQSWGGYIEWATWPRHQPFVDGRFEIHPNSVWLDYVDIVFPGAHWRDLLNGYDITYAVLSKADEPDLIEDLREEPGWRLDYEDELGAIFSRSGA